MGTEIGHGVFAEYKHRYLEKKNFCFDSFHLAILRRAIHKA